MRDKKQLIKKFKQYIKEYENSMQDVETKLAELRSALNMINERLNDMPALESQDDVDKYFRILDSEQYMNDEYDKMFKQLFVRTSKGSLYCRFKKHMNRRPRWIYLEEIGF